MSPEPQPFCSIVVPTCNRPALLRECLESLACLDYPRDRFEVIVVDDGSRAPLDALAEPFRDRLDLTLLSQPNSGPAAARNAGAERARGDLIVFTDDDCRCRPDWLVQLAGRFRAGPRHAYGGRNVTSFPDNAYRTAADLVRLVRVRRESGQEGARFLTTDNLAVPAAEFRELGGFDPAFRRAEDREFCSRWRSRGLSLYFEPEALGEHTFCPTLAGLCRRYFRYGRGALRFHRSEAKRGQRVQLEGSFYLDLVREAFAHERGVRAVRLVSLVVVTQAAYAVGFLAESATAALRTPLSHAGRARRKDR